MSKKKKKKMSGAVGIMRNAGFPYIHAALTLTCGILSTLTVLPHPNMYDDDVNENNHNQMLESINPSADTNTPLFFMLPFIEDTSDITIPSVFISQTHYRELRYLGMELGQGFLIRMSSNEEDL